MKFLFRIRTWEYRQQNQIVKVSRPSRLEKARMLGYKNKQGVVVYRVRVRRGDRTRPARKGVVYGKPKSIQVTGIKGKKNLQSIGEERVGRKCKGLTVLNSYWVAQDAVNKFFEVILIDTFR